MPGFNIPNQSPGCPTNPDQRGQPSNTVETARRHRYLLEVLEPLGQLDNGILLFLEKCTRPSPEYDKIVIHSSQTEISRPGKTHWKEVEFSFYEKLDGSDNGSLESTCAKLIYEWHAKTMVNIVTSLHNPPSQYLKNATLQMLDGDGSPVWTYNIYDAWPMKVSPSDLSYSDTDISTIAVTLAYARAKESGRGR
jgi:hypothetical protein